MARFGSERAASAVPTEIQQRMLKQLQNVTADIYRMSEATGQDRGTFAICTLVRGCSKSRPARSASPSDGSRTCVREALRAFAGARGSSCRRAGPKRANSS